MKEQLAIAGSGTIACGLAAAAAQRGPVTLWARSDASAARAEAVVAKACAKLEADPGRVAITTDLRALERHSFVVEAIAEELDAKRALFERVRLDPRAVLASTTSSLPLGALAEASGRPERFLGFHVFNPVPRMPLVELAFPEGALDETRARAHALCAALEKQAVEVPTVAGFVVNRLLFPYLFSAARLVEETGMAPEAVDTCMKLGAAHPMGPLELLDFVGLDVAVAIGESLGEPVPRSVRRLVAQGHLGRKTGRGFYTAA